MYTALYRTWRPEVFSSMSGQAHIIRILKNQLTSGQIGHAYLFCGTRGTGKTTTARIFAKGVNCLSESAEKPCGQCEHCREIQDGAFIDVIEIDAASNNGVENIRELRESVKYPPAKGRCKVYIIDEVHMLSSGAFNALLKTLEEPPAHVIFILATTEIHKLPATILSRCLRLDFRRLSEKEIIDKMQEICLHNGVEAEESALSLIAVNADGAMRDALGILDQCFSAVDGRVTRRDVVDILGTAGEEIFIRLTEQVLAKTAPEALMTIDMIAADGKDIRQFLKDWIFYFRNLMIAKYADKLENMINLSCENIEKIKSQSESCPMAFISLAITELSKASAEARWSAQPRTLLELAVIKLTDLHEEASLEALAARVAELEKRPVSVTNEKVKQDVLPNLRTGVSADSQDRSVRPIKTKGSASAESVVSPDTHTPDLPENLSQDLPENLPELWDAIFKQGVAKKITFNMLAKGVNVAGMDDKVITLEAETPPKVSCIEQNTDLIRDIVKNITGKNVKVECRISEKSVALKSRDASRQDAAIEKLGKLIDDDKLIITD